VRCQQVNLKDGGSMSVELPLFEALNVVMQSETNFFWGVKMTRTAVFILCMCLTTMMFVSTGRATQAEPDGFRGFKWGAVITTKEQVEKLGFDTRQPVDGITGYLDKSGEVLFYRMDGDIRRTMQHKEKIGNVNIEYFYGKLHADHGLYEIGFMVDPRDASKMIAVLNGKYGQPTSEIKSAVNSEIANYWESDKGLVEFITGGSHKAECKITGDKTLKVNTLKKFKPNTDGL
jgi:hypothetical protein